MCNDSTFFAGPDLYRAILEKANQLLSKLEKNSNVSIQNTELSTIERNKQFFIKLLYLLINIYNYFCDLYLPEKLTDSGLASLQ
ncbi:hypothetical protein BC008_02590 [Mastigocoleus testarum BC008]|uniref:Uncharacterized protein n=1 Tax=Mastigocoleus testarum BC008 TaxID=371196 RepID=A0A0V7ZX51_9CYAN|nr:hypothetical protein BC008_02590 [Mastigocoleus testarum BC008]